MLRNLLKLDWIMLTAALLLVVIGALALFSITLSGGNINSSYLYRQGISILIGIVLLFLLAFSDYRVFNSWSTRLYFGAVALLLLVIIFGTSVRGTVGWLGFSWLRFQPVEIIKLIMIIFLASFLSKKRTELSIFVRVIASIALVLIPVILILSQPDFGSAVIVLAIWLGMLLVSGINKKNIFLLMLIIFSAGLSGSFFLKDYQQERIINFLKPQQDPRGSGYNVIQSMVAVGSGGIWGKGLGHGSQSQLNFIPERHTDFIFAVIAEELGFVGSAVVLFLFGILFYRLRETARLARDNFGYLMAVGILLMYFSQVFINIGMNIGLVPVAGVPLPLLSYGGSSLTVMLASLGIVQSIYLRKLKTD
ncbi:MAG: rod shape-determining protein RodA [Candidatus Moranbacteria bacterium]|nr:rod shape-determining protein RodA [Candidatus Moranbacteria bacterium]